MVNLKFADTHNMIAFLSNPEESEGFEQIMDFLNAHPIKYATVNPTIYISCIEQFWSTLKAKTINREVQMHALVDDKKIIITESTVRRDLQLEDAEGVDCLPNSTIFEQLTLMGLKTTAWNEFSSTMASAIICLATNQKFNFSKYIFESMIRNLDNLSGKFLMYPSENVVDEAVHKKLGDSLVRAATTASSLEAEQDSESSGDEEDLGEDASKQGRRINAINGDEDIILVNVQDDADNEMFDVNVLNGEEVFVAGQNKNVVKEVCWIADQDKGKGIMIEEPVKPMKKKDQISFDEEVALKLQAEFDKKERLAREKAEKEKEANIALIEE
ncbi:hypothetical protein Tco_1577757 [Tanacetum coccineum]